MLENWHTSEGQTLFQKKKFNEKNYENHSNIGQIPLQHI